MKRRSKARNEPIIYNGIRYDSKVEARRAQQLDLLYRCDEIVGWERQVWFQLCPAFRCRIDFVVETLKGKKHAEDVKGWNSPRWRDICKHWAIANPMPLIVLRAKGAGWRRFQINEKGQEIMVT